MKMSISPELLFANNFTQILNDELSRAERLLGADAPPFALSAETLQTLDPLVSLDMLVVTMISTWTRAGRTLSKAHPVKNNFFKKL